MERRRLPTSSPSGYLRTSTKKQDLESQRRAVTEWAEHHGHDLVLFEDDGTSGRRADRKGIKALLAAAERGEFDFVAVSELSRIGRSIGFITRTIEQLCELEPSHSDEQLGLFASSVLNDN